MLGVRTPTTYPPPVGHSNYRLSHITEKTENSSRPVSGASFPGRAAAPSPDPAARRSFLGGAVSPSSHSRSSTEPTSDRELPPPGRAGQLIARFETSSPGPSGHTRSGSAPNFRRSPSPTKSSGSSSGSYDTRQTGSYTYNSSYLSAPPRPLSATESRSSSPVYGTGSVVTDAPSYTASDAYTGTGTYTDTATGYTATTPTIPRTFSTLTSSQQPTQATPTGSGSSQTGSSTITASNTTLRRPERSNPRYPVASVRNIVQLWKERSPTKASPAKGPPSVASDSSASEPPAPPPRDDSLFGLRRRVSGRFSGRSDDAASGASNVISPEVLGELSRFVGPSDTVSSFSDSASRSDNPLAHPSWDALLPECPHPSAIRLAAMPSSSLLSRDFVVVDCTGCRKRCHSAGPRQLQHGGECAELGSSACTR